MTLIVGVTCRDGVVLGADGAASIPGLLQLQCKKLGLVGDRIVMGSSGNSPLAQFLRDAIGQVSQDPQAPLSHPELVGMALGKSVRLVTDHLTQQAATLRQQFPNISVVDPSSETLIALAVADSPRLFCLYHTGSYFEVTEQQTFACIGSGAAPAYPFLGLLKRILWSSSLPTVREGIFTVLWAIDHVIKVAPGGVGEPIQMATLHKEADVWKASEVPKQAFQEDLQRINELEGQIGAGISQFIQAQGNESEPVEIPDN